MWRVLIMKYPSCDVIVAPRYQFKSDAARIVNSIKALGGKAKLFHATQFWSPSLLLEQA